MDLARFGLGLRPFSPLPDTAAYVPNAGSEAALTALRQAFDSREPAALLEGAPGLGKTTVALKFLESLPPEVARIAVPSARFTHPSDLFQTLLFDLDAPYRGLSETELRLAVTDRLLTQLKVGPTVVVLDEAQHLSDAILEELRLLGNLASRATQGLFVVLVGLPTFRPRLAGPGLAGFGQRLAVRAILEPLSAEESAEYLTGQLKAARARKLNVLSGEARDALAAACGGVPRVLNQAAGLAFSLAEASGGRAVDLEAALGALEQLGLAAQDDGDGTPIPQVDELAEQPSRRQSA